MVLVLRADQVVVVGACLGHGGELVPARAWNSDRGAKYMDSGSLLDGAGAGGKTKSGVTRHKLFSCENWTGSFECFKGISLVLCNATGKPLPLLTKANESLGTVLGEIDVLRPAILTLART